MYDTKVRAFVEGRSYAPDNLEDFSEVIKTIEGKRIFNEKESKFEMCGFLVVNDTPVIIFPKNYPIDDGETFLSKDICNEGKRLFRTFGLYRSRMTKTSGWLNRPAYGMNENDADAITGIEEILYILNDYQQNGYLVRRHKVLSQARPGRIVWSKTLHKTVPLVSHNQVIYAMPYMKSNVRHEEEMVQKIHRYLVSKFCRQWGWLVDGIEGADIEKIEPPCSPNEAIKYLSDELTSCFVQREIDLLRAMRSYYTRLHGKSTELRTEYMLTPEFEQIWQNVCGYVMGNVCGKYETKVPKFSFTPSPQMVERDNEKYVPIEWSQKLDIICERDDEFYILDAKYYPDYKIPKEDITKQFMYAYTMSETENIKANVLLFPGNYDGEHDFTYIGDATITNTNGLRNIQFWELNVKTMLDAYNNDVFGCKEKEFLRMVDKKKAQITPVKIDGSISDILDSQNFSC